MDTPERDMNSPPSHIAAFTANALKRHNTTRKTHQHVKLDKVTVETRQDPWFKALLLSTSTKCTSLVIVKTANSDKAFLACKIDSLYRKHTVGSSNSSWQLTGC
jgi:hypothetical protein